MPVDFLTDAQAAAYGAFPEEIEEADLHRFFLLDDEDCQNVGRRRRDANRLGYAVQLCALCAIGRFVASPMEVPAEALRYVAGQLGISDTIRSGFVTSGLRAGLTEHDLMAVAGHKSRQTFEGYAAPTQALQNPALKQR